MIIWQIPIRTRSEANLRGHWTARHKRASSQRAATRLAWIEAGKPEIPLPGVARLCRIAPRRLDDDNLAGSLKATRDEIAKIAGVDDAPDSPLRWEAPIQRLGPPKTYAVEVLIRRGRTDAEVIAALDGLQLTAERVRGVRGVRATRLGGEATTYADGGAWGETARDAIELLLDREERERQCA